MCADSQIVVAGFAGSTGLGKLPFSGNALIEVVAVAFEAVGAVCADTRESIACLARSTGCVFLPQAVFTFIDVVVRAFVSAARAFRA